METRMRSVTYVTHRERQHK